MDSTKQSSLPETPPSGSTSAAPAQAVALIPALPAAGISFRGPALLIDYLVTVALFAIATAYLPPETPSIVGSLAPSLLYFTVCHSWLGRGQSFGKKLLGLRVIRYGTAGDGQPIYLSLRLAFRRYMVFLGAIIVLVEVPPMIYRMNVTIAPTWMLQLHMLFALVWIMLDAAVALVGAGNRSLHDRLARSVVIRSRWRIDEETRAKTLAALAAEPPRPAGFRNFIVGISALTGVLMWIWGIVLPAPLEWLSRYQYAFEHEHPHLQLASMTYDSSKRAVALDILVLQDHQNIDDDAMAHHIVSWLQLIGAVPEGTLSRFSIRFFRRPGVDGQITDAKTYSVPLSGAPPP